MRTLLLCYNWVLSVLFKYHVTVPYFKWIRNKNCSRCNIKLDKDNYKRYRTVSKDCYNKKKKNKFNTTPNQKQQQKIENVITNNNNRRLLLGPSLSGKTYLMLKILSRLPDRDICLITKSSPEQYADSGIKNKEITDEIKPLDEYERCVIVFDDILVTTNSR